MLAALLGVALWEIGCVANEPERALRYSMMKRTVMIWIRPSQTYQIASPVDTYQYLSLVITSRLLAYHRDL